MAHQPFAFQPKLSPCHLTCRYHRKKLQLTGTHRAFSITVSNRWVSSKNWKPVIPKRMILHCIIFSLTLQPCLSTYFNLKKHLCRLMTRTILSAISTCYYLNILTLRSPIIKFQSQIHLPGKMQVFSSSAVLHFLWRPTYSQKGQLYIYFSLVFLYHIVGTFHCCLK